MPVKRSRVCRSSSSFGDTGVLDQLFPPVTEPSQRQLDVRAEPPGNASKARKPSAVEAAAETVRQQSRPTNLFVSSPEIEKAGREMQIDNFMDKCHYCNKKIGENQEVFMYRSFGAFCSSECRDKAIEMDEAAEKSTRTT
ncbi:hypothetical protein FNV43_RR23360 [Rhamnella rubrinervis]|uniref:FLZ-type domain-containing protein n=1 Tax=Rhamnella rubrinervis TaxID=2594499 RepID=A0A8K0DW01_9ROSA|nr:hypothetical protein FNV43_RR23360 [Rhamnella rubrinervis]